MVERKGKDRYREKESIKKREREQMKDGRTERKREI